MKPYSDHTDVNLKAILLGRASLILGAIFASSVATRVLLSNHMQQAINEVPVLPIGASMLAVFGMLLGAMVPPKARVKVLLAIAVLAAVLITSGILVVTSPAGIPSCPASQDCDPAFGVGAMMLTVVLTPVYLALLYVGRFARSLTKRTPSS